MTTPELHGLVPQNWESDGSDTESLKQTTQFPPYLTNLRVQGCVARAVCHGRRGELYQKYRRGLEDQLGALGLVVNAIVLWNTRYGEAVLGHLRGLGEDLYDEDIARLSPLKFAHINVRPGPEGAVQAKTLERYHFEMSPDVAAGDLRPLRDPDSLDTLERLWLE